MEKKKKKCHQPRKEENVNSASRWLHSSHVPELMRSALPPLVKHEPPRPPLTSPCTEHQTVLNMHVTSFPPLSPFYVYVINARPRLCDKFSDTAVRSGVLLCLKCFH